MLLIKAFIQLSQDGHTRYITLFKIIFSPLSARSKMLGVYTNISGGAHQCGEDPP